MTSKTDTADYALPRAMLLLHYMNSGSSVTVMKQDAAVGVTKCYLEACVSTVVIVFLECASGAF